MGRQVEGEPEKYSIIPIIIITTITTITTSTTITTITKMSPGRYEVEASCTFSSEAALDVAHELPEHQETMRF